MSHIYISNIIKDSEIGKHILPIYVCPYKNGNKYMMVEVNTGNHKGSIIPITKTFNSLDNLLKSFNKSQTVYPVLFDHIIYNDLYISHL